ncbi:hypothetical protein M3697_17330 [Janibacter melonis]|uniref:hypothetical protein n=1 Tax=Janibacter melonis TaxID=262209 RepID=UPI002043662E|nr:hypothetical protein [Janibacter melonis]MCM3556845.1 hypothetical protein [Janibacter melonis]
MTPPTIDPELETQLRARLHAVADQAPPSDPEAVLASLQPHRRRWAPALLTAAAAAALVAGALTVHNVSNQPRPAPATTTDALPAIADGWRWEAYHNVAVAVPDSWGYGVSGIPYCALTNPADRTTVGRPDAVPLLGCPPEGIQPDSVAIAGAYVDFYPARDLEHRIPKAADGDTTGDRTTRVIGTTAIDVQARQPLRDQILATITALPASGVNGCQRSNELISNPSWRPDPASLPAPKDVQHVAVCTYDTGADGGLRAATQMPAPAAARTVEALSAAPEGGTPDRGECSDDYGDRVTVLRLTVADDTAHDVVLRYAGCANRGIDDGTTVRALTKTALADVLIGAHRPDGYGTELSPVMP